MSRNVRAATLAIAAGLATSAFTTDLAGVHAESAMDFLRNQHRRAQGQQAYMREPVRVERSGGFFDDLFRFDRPEPRSRRTASPSAGLQRVICKRQCDGAQLVLGILPARGNQQEAQSMCTAAGGDAATELVLEKFVPGEGFAPPPTQMASSAPLLEGRASLAPDVAKNGAYVQYAQGCRGVAGAYMSVPILYDATLRNGDLVATGDGFKVFTGRGDPPFKESDFTPLEARKKMSADLRNLKVADR